MFSIRFNATDGTCHELNHIPDLGVVECDAPDCCEWPGRSTSTSTPTSPREEIAGSGHSRLRSDS